MTRPLAVPFALPDRTPPSWAVLPGMPQFVVLLAGVLLVPFTLAALLQPWIDDQLAQRKVLAYRAAFGFDVGDVANEWGGTYWGFTAIAPGGVAERAGLRVEDVIFARHGGPGLHLHSALDQATSGEEACLRVANMREVRAGHDASRVVCLPPVSP